ncbi:MAG: PAS domain S-box protein [Methylococcaceae bacterium]
MEESRSNKFSLPLFLAVVTFCITPFALNKLGIDFSSTSIPLPEPRSLLLDDLFYKLSGAFTHTILEWSAFSVAISIGILGIVHFRVSKEVTVPVICIALFCAGSMDAFHTLAADRLIDSVADNKRLIPFTWAISRTFNALIIISGVSIFLLKPQLTKKAGFNFVIIISLVFIILAYLIIHYCATSKTLPETIFPNAFITRPWDVGPLILYAFICIPLIVRFNKIHPSTFSHMLLLSMVPDIIVELHMAFGSKALFDNDFNIAHFLKIFAYLIPGIGLLVDYVQTFTRLEKTTLSLLEEKTKIKSIVDNAIDGIITTNNMGYIQSFNPSAEHLFGYQKKDIINKNIKILMPESDHRKIDIYLKKYNQTGMKNIIGNRREVSGLHKDGTIFPLEMGINEVNLGNMVFYTGFLRDISQQKKLEYELKAREQLFSTFINSAPVMMWMLDANNKPLMFNDTWLDFTGNTLEQELACEWNGMQIHPKDQEKVMSIYNEAIIEQNSFDLEYRMQRYDGIYCWIREIGVPHYENNTYKNFIGICLDITQRKIDELNLKKYTQDLKRSNKELEQFAYIASHDLQEPLRMVSSYTQLLERRYKDKLDDDASEFIGYAVDGANRMQTLIQDLLAYSRVGKNKQILKLLELDLLIKNIILGLKVAIEESNVQINLPESFPQLMADQSQIQQLFQNLILNAIKYRAEERKCEININYQKVDKMWQFSIQDNGIGIETKYFERIFVIFKRLHSREKYSGTGIGLAVCKRIVEGHGGELWLESTFGSGSTFYFTIPIDL